MKISARNSLAGTVESIQTGEAMATVKLRLNGSGQVITAAITKDSAVDLGLAEGVAVTAVIKATEVILATD
jgi:molybdate transport system regulatory protein